MPDEKPRPAIPAWQRAAPPPAQDDPVSSQADVQDAEPSAPAVTSTEEPSESTEQEPAVTDAPEEQKDSATSSLQASDFQSFQQLQQRQQPTQQAPPQRSQPPPPPSPPSSQLQSQSTPAAPPIITYPEFLVDAHKPPPLVTPSTVVNSLYIAGGVAAALYGASKFLISPMVDSLTVARHDALLHRQSKLDAFNARLSTLVRVVPGPRSTAGSEAGDADSDTSDPTELYHRDMGTQTSPPPSPRSASPAGVNFAVDGDQVHGLGRLRSHLEQLVTGAEQAGESARQRQKAADELQHELDTMLYSNSGINVWPGEGDAATPPNDAVEALKRDIRGVKGVLLSAKRFPALGRTVPGTA